ncbi:MAG: hypothetical protein AAF548_10865 [Actinomycetota bacterium]
MIPTAIFVGLVVATYNRWWHAVIAGAVAWTVIIVVAGNELDIVFGAALLGAANGAVGGAVGSGVRRVADRLTPAT